MEQRYHVYDRHAKGLGQEQVPTGKSMWNVCVAPRSACPVRWRGRPGVVPDLTSGSHVKPSGQWVQRRNMTTIYPNSTLIPPPTGDPNTDLDANQRSFDVYEAYQRALADDEVSLHTLLTSRSGFSSRHPVITSFGSDPFSHGAPHMF